MIPVCGFSFDGVVCGETGRHLCEPRAEKVRAFFSEILVHTKGRWARKPFHLELWQFDDIIRPLFGTVRWSDELGEYARQFTLAWVELARKTGKSELGAGIALTLAVGDDEEGAEVYGAAKDKGQARKVWDVAHRMVQLSPILRKRFTVDKRSLKLTDAKTASVYEVIARDAEGELGHNPHGVIFDEVISQPDRTLYDALRTAEGARSQPLMFMITTAGDDITGFAGTMHTEMLRVAEDPKRAPHVFVYIRNTPEELDPFDEATWVHANPALGAFKSVESMRRLAAEAKNSPEALQAFIQFHLNRWVQPLSRFISLPAWDACIGEVAPTPEWMIPKLEGQVAYGGLDLSSKIDLTSLSWWVPESQWMMWRFWLPESALSYLSKATGGQAQVWADQGWITLTDGDVIDYEAIYDQIGADAETLAIHTLAYDEWSGEPVRQQIVDRHGIDMYPSRMIYQRTTGPLKELERLVRSKGLSHGGNPVARFCMESLEVRRNRSNPEEIRPERPDRAKTGGRIDGAITAMLAVDAQLTAEAQPENEVAFFSL